MTQSPGVGAPLAAKLNYLFEMVRPPGEDRPYTDREIVAAMNAAGFPISASHMSELRRGKRVNPTISVVNGIATVFDVRVAYLLDDAQVVEEVEVELDLRRAQRDAAVADIVAHAAVLDPRQRAALHRELARIIREQDEQA